MSLPSRERGLKFTGGKLRMIYEVAPFAGAWIEIYMLYFYRMTTKVAPFAGAWIEIQSLSHHQDTPARRSLRGSVD